MPQKARHGWGTRMDGLSAQYAAWMGYLAKRTGRLVFWNRFGGLASASRTWRVGELAGWRVGELAGWRGRHLEEA